MHILAIPMLIIGLGLDMTYEYHNLTPYLYVLAAATFFQSKSKYTDLFVIGLSVTLIITATLGFILTQDPTVIITRSIALISIILLQRPTTRLHKEISDKEKLSEQQTTLLDNISDGMIITDKLGVVQYMNPVAEALTCCSLDQAKRITLSRVFPLVDEKTKSPIANPIDAVLKSKQRTSVADNILLRGSKPHEIVIEHAAIPISSYDNTLQGAAIIFRDLTNAREISQQLSYHTCHDPITGLLNRAEFERRLERVISACSEEDTQHVLFYLDLQEFKMVADNCGRDASEQLLTEVSSLLKTKMRKRDTLARLGGDEFGIILEHCTLEKAQAVAEQLNQLIQGYRFSWDGKIFSIGLSSGLVKLDHQTKSLEWALSLALYACKLAQRAGRNIVHVIDPAETPLENLPSESTWVDRITQAIEHSHFELFVQKIRPVGTQYVNDNFIELHVSMLDEDGNPVPAGAFLPVAKRHGLHSQIDQWAISALISELSSNRVLLKQTAGFCINICPQSVSDPSFFNYLKDQLVWANIPADKICLEISESAAFSNIGDTNTFIEKVKKLGCRISLDQYGSGFSTFSQLKNLAVDYIKIDGSFIKTMNSDRVDSTMVESINQIAHMLGLETIATHCENEVTYKHLRRIGVDYVQGFHISKPQKFSTLSVPQVA